jgi:hypothetical protein
MPKLKTADILDFVINSQEFQTTFLDEMDEKRTNKFLTNKKNWKRNMKVRLDLEPLTYGCTIEEVFELSSKDWGDVNETELKLALQLYKNSPIKNNLPLVRDYMLESYLHQKNVEYTLGDFTLEVWSTFDDMKIIGWTMSVD